MDREAAGRVVDPNCHKQPAHRRGANDCVIRDAGPDLDRLHSVRIIPRARMSYPPPVIRARLPVRCHRRHDQTLGTAEADVGSPRKIGADRFLWTEVHHVGEPDLPQQRLDLLGHE